MQPFRLTLELRGPLGTPLAADTLWGHLAWGIRHRQGNDALEQWLGRYDEGELPIVFSDPFPAGHFPRPVLPQPVRPKEPPSRDDVQAFKNESRRKWVKCDAWEGVCRELSPANLRKAVAESHAGASYQIAVTHAGVNRMTGGTAQLDGGSLFDLLQTYYRPGARFDVWGWSSEDLDVVRTWFEWGLEGGYGRDAATGMGWLVVEGIESAPLPAPSNPNAGMLLGPALPRPGDPCRGFFQTVMKSGRLGSSFSIGEIPGNNQQRQKYPVTLLQAGTVLVCDDPPAFVGRVIGGVHEWDAIRQYGVAPLLPVRLADELLEHPLLAS